jgi:hypothetical protein
VAIRAALGPQAFAQLIKPQTAKDLTMGKLGH